MMLDPSTTKYQIRIKIHADGVVEKPDVVGAIFGQTEGLLGEELDLRDLQKSGRIGRIEVDINSKQGKADGEVIIPSSLDQVETSIMASALETIDRIGPCKAKMTVLSIDDVRVTKRNTIVERAKELLAGIIEDSKDTSTNLADSVRESVQIHEILTYGPDRCPAGPNVSTSDAIIVVEGRNDVTNLLKAGIKHAIAVEGTNVPNTIKEISTERVVTAFVDGDRGGELVLRELIQVAEVDFIARAPNGKEVEELTSKQIMKALRNKVPAEQFMEMTGIDSNGRKKSGQTPPSSPPSRSSTQKKSSPKDMKKGKVAAPAKPAKPSKPENKLNDKQADLKKSFNEIAGSNKARIIGPKNNLLAEILIKDLAETLKTGKDIETVIFDGIITQRIIDIASEQKIKTIVATKIGNVSKQPANLTILTKADLT
ncbi:MAG: DNA primase [Thermoplasmata archaeon]|nr:DNA primase [Thermoplasmata archaeon]